MTSLWLFSVQGKQARARWKGLWLLTRMRTKAMAMSATSSSSMTGACSSWICTTLVRASVRAVVFHIATLVCFTMKRWCAPLSGLVFVRCRRCGVFHDGSVDGPHLGLTSAVLLCRLVHLHFFLNVLVLAMALAATNRKAIYNRPAQARMPTSNLMPWLLPSGHLSNRLKSCRSVSKGQGSESSD